MLDHVRRDDVVHGLVARCRLQARRPQHEIDVGDGGDVHAFVLGVFVGEARPVQLVRIQHRRTRPGHDGPVQGADLQPRGIERDDVVRPFGPFHLHFLD